MSVRIEDIEKLTHDELLQLFRDRWLTMHLSAGDLSWARYKVADKAAADAWSALCSGGLLRKDFDRYLAQSRRAERLQKIADDLYAAHQAGRGRP